MPPVQLPAPAGAGVFAMVGTITPLTGYAAALPLPVRAGWIRIMAVSSATPERCAAQVAAPLASVKRVLAYAAAAPRTQKCKRAAALLRLAIHPQPGAFRILPSGSPTVRVTGLSSTAITATEAICMYSRILLAQ